MAGMSWHCSNMLLIGWCRCHNLGTPRDSPHATPFDSLTHSGKSYTPSAKTGGKSTPSKGLPEFSRAVPGVVGGAAQGGSKSGEASQTAEQEVAPAAAMAGAGDSATSGGPEGGPPGKVGGLRAWLAARQERIRQARAERGVPDLEAAAGLAPMRSGDANAESAFRIWSLPNEGAITSDPYSKVSGSVERKDSRPPSRPS